MKIAETMKVAPLSRNTASTPNQATSAPPNAGPRNIAACIEMLFSAFAGPSRLCGTIAGRIALRAGLKIADKECSNTVET
jgi:hypothetical protein